jgi:hypothetical protein
MDSRPPEKRVTEARTGLEENGERGRARYLESLEAVDTGGKVLPTELLEVETEVVEALWDELLRDPVLESFDEELDEVLGR